MNYTVEYIKQNKMKAEIYDQINHMRLYKRAVLLVELIEKQGQSIIECFESIEAKSLLE